MLTLITLFNQGYDFARLRGEDYLPETNRDRATHRLICTHWNTFPGRMSDVKKRIRAVKCQPEGLALAVCAFPLRKRPNRKLSQKLRYFIPSEDMPVYKRRGPLEGRRRVLTYMTSARFHDHPHKMRRLIRSLTGERCNALYITLLRASNKALKRARKQSRRNKQPR